MSQNEARGGQKYTIVNFETNMLLKCHNFIIYEYPALGAAGTVTVTKMCSIGHTLAHGLIMVPKYAKMSQKLSQMWLKYTLTLL